MSSPLIDFPEMSSLYPPREGSSRLLIGCPKRDYSASRISTAVEDCNAHVLNLNLTDIGAGEQGHESDMLVVDLRVSHRSPEAVCRSLERYGYEVLLARAQDPEDEGDPHFDTLRARINELLRYIEI